MVVFRNPKAPKGVMFAGRHTERHIRSTHFPRYKRTNLVENAVPPVRGELKSARRVTTCAFYRGE